MDGAFLYVAISVRIVRSNYSVWKGCLQYTAPPVAIS